MTRFRMSRQCPAALLSLLLLLTALAAPAQKQTGRAARLAAAGQDPKSPGHRTIQDSSRRGIVTPTLLFPHVVVGGGYSTVFALLNTGGSELNGTVILTAANGSPMQVRFSSPSPGSEPNQGGKSTSGAASSFPITIPAGGARFIAASAPNPDDPTQTGQARVESFGGSAQGVATFQHHDSAGKLIASAGVLSVEAVQVATIPIDDDRSRNCYTGFAVANHGMKDITIKGVLVEDNPSTPVDTFTVSLGAGRQLASYFFQIAKVPEKFRGSVILTLEQGEQFSVVALLQNSGLYATIPVVPSPPAPHSILVLTNGTVMDGTGAAPLSDGAIVIQDDRIAAVGPRSQVKIPSNAQIIDVQGGTILPGFFNTHVHNAFSESNLRAWAQAGVTSVRDMAFGGGQLWWPFTFRDEHEALPEFSRIVSVGPMISSPGGYPVAVWGGIGYTAASPEEARERTNEVLDQGADLIKTTLESGLIVQGRVGLPIFSKEESRAIIDTAHHRGVPVVVHVTAVMDLVKAVDYGFDEIAHMVADPLQDENLISRMVAKDIYWVPTLELWSNYGLDQIAIANLRRFVSAGGKVALGSDFAGAPKSFQLGMPIKEMELMQLAGMTPMQIIVAATKNAAHVCKRDRTLGSLEPGKVADILVVNGDPLQDIHTLTNVRLVVRSGTVIRDAPR